MTQSGERLSSGSVLEASVSVPLTADPAPAVARRSVAEVPARRILVVAPQPFYEDRGTPKKEAKRRAWATVNAIHGGGEKSGSGRGKPENKAPYKKGGRKGGKAAAARPAAARRASARKAARTRAKNQSS